MAANMPKIWTVSASLTVKTQEVYTAEFSRSTTADTAGLSQLDALRSIAVGCVFLSHVLDSAFGITRLGPLYIGTLGYLGVIIFFVHTTLVLLLSMERSGSGGRLSSSGFLLRRAFRIYPLSILTVLAVLAFRIPRTPETVYHWVGWRTVAENVLLIQNFTGSQGSDSISSPLWTLPYEVQMYLFLPVLYGIVLHRGRWIRWGLWFGTAIAYLASALLRLPVDLLLMFAPCFIAGSFAFRVRPRIAQSRAWELLIGALAVLFLMIPRRGLGIMIGSWIGCAILGSAIPLFPPVKNGAIRWISKRVARYSYGIYLSHIPLIWLCFFAGRSLHWPIKIPCFLLLSVAVPVELHRFIEKPMIDIGKRLTVKG